MSNLLIMVIFANDQACSIHRRSNIAQLYRETIKTVNSRHYNAQQTAAWAGRGDDPERWHEKIRSQYFIVAADRDEILGFASLTTGGYLDLMFVHKDHQGKGIAKALLDAIETQAMKVGITEITTDASITARPFFEKINFQLLREQTVHIGDVAFINYKMRKDLSSNNG